MLRSNSCIDCLIEEHLFSGDKLKTQIMVPTYCTHIDISYNGEHAFGLFKRALNLHACTYTYGSYRCFQRPFYQRIIAFIRSSAVAVIHASVELTGRLKRWENSICPQTAYTINCVRFPSI
ncbi:hypothetical protein CSKR_203959 [Clonorchis sinensis]|uniref:Uncharacterized protein n=1 Tax=Clonorchis sinensis TaxID=79923 RepID=A0A8T1MK04_CLOSI|nr:hypothetical protein CSKR_203959 [Clonorchis sinensis]